MRGSVEYRPKDAIDASWVALSLLETGEGIKCGLPLDSGPHLVGRLFRTDEESINLVVISRFLIQTKDNIVTKVWQYSNNLELAID